MPGITFDYAKLTVSPRFTALVNKLGGSKGAALDCICRFWNTAIEYWGDGRRGIPEKIFCLDPEFVFLVETDFAERLDDGSGIMARGGEERFDWYAGKRESAQRAGIASAAARKEKYGSAQPNHEHAPNDRSNETRTDSEHRSNIVRTSPNEPFERPERPSNPSITVSTSISASALNAEQVSDGTSPKPRKRPQPADGTLVWDAFHAAYVARYGSEPVRNARTNANCSQLVARLGIERATIIAAWYVSHSNPWYVRNAHSIGCAVKDAEALWTQYDTGKKITTADAKSAEKDDNNKAVFERLAAKLEREGWGGSHET